MKTVCIILARCLQYLVAGVVAIALVVVLLAALLVGLGIAAIGTLFALLSLPACPLFCEVDTWLHDRRMKKFLRQLDEQTAALANKKAEQDLAKKKPV